MDSVDVTSNQKGAVGETLILHGQTIPLPVSEAIKTFIHEKYDVAENTPIRISNEHATYLNVSTNDGEYISTRTDGCFSAKWISKHRESEITRSPEGTIQNKWDLMDESVMFPVEVKSGEYAELERNQKEILETVARSNTRDHPLLVHVQIDKLPDQYELSVRVI